MKFLKYNLALLLICFVALFSTNNAFSKIIFKDVSTTGVGQSLDEAVNNALAEAICLYDKNIDFNH